MKKKKILVVGGTGFIGYHLIQYLKKKKFEIVSISTKKPKKIRKIKKIKYLLINISKKNQFNKIKNDFDYIINLGGYVDHSNKKLTYLSHYLGCVNLFNKFKNSNIKSFVQIGSSLEYGKIKSPQNERKAALKTYSVYSKSKLLATNFLIKKYKSKKFPVIILRGYQVYGPRQDNNRLISSVITNCLKDSSFPCSSGNQYRDFIHVSDFVKSIYSALMNKNALGQIINIGSGKPIKVKKIILLIKKIIKKGKPQFGRISLRKDESQILFPSIKKANRLLNWKPKVKILIGLKQTINDYKRILK